ncbi:MAG TPA: MFS transporter, partial [Lacisediminihabitans sp.]|uniref:MFS transporter n=1 Tax=Lacisediminihabitans sp. TaxID=2787631 RepID=UPI002ED938FF
MTLKPDRRRAGQRVDHPRLGVRERDVVEPGLPDELEPLHGCEQRARDLAGRHVGADPVPGPPVRDLRGEHVEDAVVRPPRGVADVVVDPTPSLQRPQVSAVALPTVLLAVFIVPLSIAGVATVLPSIARDLGADTVQLQWVVNGFNASFAVFTLVWGVISDRVGYRRTFLVGVVGSVAALVLCALAPNLARARNFALFGTTLGLGLAVGPTLSGALTAAVGWRGVFVVFAVFIAISLVLSPAVPAIRHERQADARLFDRRLLRNARFMSAVLMPVIQAFGYITLLTYLPVALSSVYGLGAGRLAVVMIALTGPAVVGPAIGARLVATVPRITVHGVFYASIALMLLGNGGMLLIAAEPPLWVLVVPMLLLGFSFGLPLGLIDGAAMDAVPAASSGSASGLLQFARLGSEALIIGVYAV